MCFYQQISFRNDVLVQCLHSENVFRTPFLYHKNFAKGTSANNFQNSEIILANLLLWLQKVLISLWAFSFLISLFLLIIILCATSTKQLIWIWLLALNSFIRDYKQIKLW